ncbi:MAG TPA: Clp protease N-terminal domain-containing protein [Egibacteraceae bacterium]|nr:Clp protease N-terminal domain-containing protein [Egibacteraceae bacterium]
MFERFTDRARRVLVFAEEEAARLAHDHVGTEHLLLGLAREGDGVAATVLAALGMTLADLRTRVDAVAGRGEAGAGVEERSYSSPAKHALETALREAQGLGDDYIGTEHVLLGLAREGEGTAARVLRDLGHGLASIRSQVIRTRSGQPRAGSDAGFDPGEGQRAWEEAGWTFLASGAETSWRALSLAREEAAGGGHTTVEVGDLVLGILRAGDEQVTGALRAAGGVSPADGAPQAPEDPPPLALSVQARDACLEALQGVWDGAGFVRPGHLLLGCLHVVDREGRDALQARLGVDVDRLVAHVRRAVDGGAG